MTYYLAPIPNLLCSSLQGQTRAILNLPASRWGLPADDDDNVRALRVYVGSGEGQPCQAGLQ